MMFSSEAGAYLKKGSQPDSQIQTRLYLVFRKKHSSLFSQGIRRHSKGQAPLNLCTTNIRIKIRYKKVHKGWVLPKLAIPNLT